MAEGIGVAFGGAVGGLLVDYAARAALPPVSAAFGPAALWAFRSAAVSAVRVVGSCGHPIARPATTLTPIPPFRVRNTSSSDSLVRASSAGSAERRVMDHPANRSRTIRPNSE